MKFEWENLFYHHTANDKFAFTDRAKVFGGWLVLNKICAGSRAHESMVFVPDPNHEWEITE
jgi:hypothetical protein